MNGWIDGPAAAVLLQHAVGFDPRNWRYIYICMSCNNNNNNNNNNNRLTDVVTDGKYVELLHLYAASSALHVTVQLCYLVV